MNFSLNNQKKIMMWLFGTCVLIWLMVMLGGATRLTHSGLSIVEWKPFTGIIPPLTEAAWAEEFATYQKFPEYQLINQGISLNDFKFIFFMEYIHRVLGRLIALFFFIPLGYFWFRGWLSPDLKKRSLIVVFLGVGQGFMGWYMVQSGLVNLPSVSPYRLTAHLILALILFGILFWEGLCHLDPLYAQKKTSQTRENPTTRFIYFCAFLIGLTITYGGFVAGLKAGKLYNTYPLMGGEFIPSEWAHLSPLWLNFFENAATVQWVHRTLAVFTAALVILAMAKILNSSYGKPVKRSAKWMIAVLCCQVGLGITTLLYEVPVSLGTLHQGMAVIVLSVMLWIIYNLRYRGVSDCVTNT
jgi:heme a synthase